MHGAKLVDNCANIYQHGQTCHQIDYTTFLREGKRVLCDGLDFLREMDVHGAGGALYKTELPKWGYTVAARGTGVECVDDLKHDSSAQPLLQLLQGKYIPFVGAMFPSMKAYSMPVQMISYTCCYSALKAFR